MYSGASQLCGAVWEQFLDIQVWKPGPVRLLCQISSLTLAFLSPQSEVFWHFIKYNWNKKQCNSSRTLFLTSFDTTVRRFLGKKAVCSSSKCHHIISIFTEKPNIITPNESPSGWILIYLWQNKTIDILHIYCDFWHFQHLCHMIKREVRKAIILFKNYTFWKEFFAACVKESMANFYDMENAFLDFVQKKWQMNVFCRDIYRCKCCKNPNNEKKNWKGFLYNMCKERERLEMFVRSECNIFCVKYDTRISI